MREIAEHWLTAAEDDLRVISRIAAEETLAHMVAFDTLQYIE